MSKNHTTRAIINADDLGISDRVNDIIFDLMRQRKITSATLMATGPAFEDAVKRIPYYPHCSFGVHLCLTQFAPLSDTRNLKPILDENGKFAGNQVRQVSLDAILRKGIYAEWCVQVERILSAGVNISHIDGHHHVHTIPQLFFILKQVQKTYKLNRVRLSRTFIDSGRSYSSTKKLLKSGYNFFLKRYYRTITTQEFGSFKDYLELAKSRKLTYETVELMVHPCLRKADKEMALLDTDWQQQLPFSIQLINYHEL